MVRLGSLEREVMEYLWAAPDAMSVREVHEGLVGRDLAYTTIMTVLDRLTKKGVVRRTQVGRAWHYRPAASKDAMIADLMREALDGIESADTRAAALVAFVERATPEEANALREALEALGQEEAEPPTAP